MYPTIVLKKEKERSVQRFHPWIFSGALHSFDANLKDGDLVEIQDFRNNFLRIGHFYHGSIAIKILSFEEKIVDQKFWNNKIKQALLLRKTLGFIDNKNTNCFRLIHAEGDNCPGLIIDIYDTTAVIQCHSIGMHRCIQEIKNAIQNEVTFIDTIYDKSAAYLPKEYAETTENTYLLGHAKEIIAIENGNKFLIDAEYGQKTGFFLDQRDNRNLLTKYCTRQICSKHLLLQRWLFHVCFE
jgi:23S rRNA (cytosine1962-C5)-methyltransferase